MHQVKVKWGVGNQGQIESRIRAGEEREGKMFKRLWKEMIGQRKENESICNNRGENTKMEVKEGNY